jgi:hypothetical protein
MADATPPRTPPGAFAYEACDIPPGMTISEFRAQRMRSRRTRRFSRLRRALRRLRPLRLA